MKRLSAHTRNRFFPLLALLVALACWFLAIRPTVSAISLHRKLSRDTQSSLAESPSYLKTRFTERARLLDSYRVDSADWSNNFWLTLSGAARRKGLDVIYSPAVPAPAPVTDSLPPIRTAAMTFRGPYTALVSLLDTAERSKGIGRPVYIRFAKEKAFSGPEEGKLGMYVLFGVIGEMKQQ